MTHHTAKANLEKGSSWPLEAMKKVLYHPTLLVVTLSNRPTPWTHPSPDSLLRVIYYYLDNTFNNLFVCNRVCFGVWLLYENVSKLKCTSLLPLGTIQNEAK